MRHIRRSDKHHVKDSILGMVSTPTFCGAEPARDDRSKKEGRQLIAAGKANVDWLEGICPACLAALSAARSGIVLRPVKK